MTDKTRDELIRQVDAMGHTQQQLIERLAQIVINTRYDREAFRTLYVDTESQRLDARRWAATWKAKAKWYRRDNQLNRRMLARCCDRNWDYRAWAKAWKAKAKFDRWAWMRIAIWWDGQAWHRRRAWHKKQLSESG